jgi:hypothetical protein
LDSGLAEFIHDLLALGELQAKLAAVNFQETARKATVPLALGLLGFTLAVASVFVFLIGLALLLAIRLDIHTGWAMILVAIAAAALGSPIAALALVRLKRSLDTFQTSHDELKRNLAWVRSVVGTRISS